jgi:23S rRNA (cytidine1920-2'-O)/16S rRNA (cytidine1409-2'-O)-methyltransferase
VGEKERLDKLMTQRRLVRSRSRAQRMIMAGRVRVNGQTVYRPGHMILLDASIDIASRSPYVSRGGEKLEQALAVFHLDPSGAICLDVGCSTGGFTDCLLQRGAVRVHSVDVGKGQLDWRLRNDNRVVVHEGLNARYLTPEDIGEQVDLATIDVSFISLRLILPPLIPIVRKNGCLIVLVKPQFEAGKDAVGKGGVIRDQATHLAVLENVDTFVKGETPWSVTSATYSPLLGPAGNIEFFYLLHGESHPQTGGESIDLRSLVACAHSELIEGERSS